MDQKKKIGILVSVIFSLVAHMIFNFSGRTIVLIVVVGGILYFVITEYFHVKSFDDVVDKGTELRDKVDEVKITEATLHHRASFQKEGNIDVLPNAPVVPSEIPKKNEDDSLSHISPDPI